MYSRTDTSSQPLLCVVHIPKTAGSAIRETLISILGWEKVYWISHKRPFENWTNSSGDDFNDYAVVGGHCSATAFHKIKRPKIFMAVVRDPVQRAISLFNYITCGPDPDHGLRGELSGLSLVEAIKTSVNFRRDVENRQCGLIGGQPTFSAALHTISEGEWFIDHHEAVDELFAGVCDRFGWPSRPLVSDNVGREGYADAYLSDKSTIIALNQINQEDRLLVSILDKTVVRGSPSRAASNLHSVRSASPAGSSCSGRLHVLSGREQNTCLIEAAANRAISIRNTNAGGENAAIGRTLPIPTPVGADQLITAAYKAVLGRSPDPGGLRTYGNLFKDVSLPQGLERVVRGLLGSAEFLSKRTGAGEHSNPAPNLPEICSFTREQAVWVSSLGTRTDRVLVARFNPDPGSHPTIYLRDSSLLGNYRVSQSLRYIHTLISRFLVNPDYYYKYFDTNLSHSKEMFCAFQIDDQSVDNNKTVAYCRSGSQPTLIPDLQFWISNGYFNTRQQIYKCWLQWGDRVPQVFWRGSSTGAEIITLESLPKLPRFRLCAASANRSRLASVLDAKLTNIVQACNADEASKLRAHVESLGLMSAHVPPIDFLKYRFHIDIDGNSNSWGLLPKLMMGSCVLKVVSIWHQWYYDGLYPWVHYVPIKNDLSDLEDQVAWCLDNDDAAREIGVNGMKYATRIVFGTEMLTAAGSILRASHETLGVIS
jgi:hypothetical protein